MTIFGGNHPTFSPALNAFMAARPTRGGLPQDVLLDVLGLYDRGTVSWNEVLRRRDLLSRKLTASMPQVVLARSERRSVGVRKPAAALSAFHVNAAPFGESEAFFGASIDAFIFWRWGAWWYRWNDPVVATGHLHRRAMTRGTQALESFAEFHSALSVLWPAFIELGNQRRKSGRKAELTYFIIPLWGGLAFGELQRIEDLPGFAPALWICQNREMREIILEDGVSFCGQRMLVNVKTMFSPDRLNRRQKNLKAELEKFASDHGPALRYLLLQHRHGHYAQAPFRSELQAIFSTAGVSAESVQMAIDELDQITSSEQWLAETARSRAASDTSAA